MLRLYDSRLSGNSWKIRILLNQLEMTYERVTLDILKGETHTPEFEKISPFARVPVLRLEDGRYLMESSAILIYLALGTQYLPTDRYLQSQVVAWLAFEQGDLQRPLSLCRLYHKRGMEQLMASEIARLHGEGYLAMEKLERWLTDRHWLVGDAYSVADLGVFGYVAMADEGGFDLSAHGATKRWVDRVKNQPGWIELLPEIKN